MSNQIKVGTMGSDGKIEYRSPVAQNHLTAECWTVQFWGTETCKTCEVKSMKECGGKRILKTGKNELGFKVGKTGLQ
jgi:hypothetical protein